MTERRFEALDAAVEACEWWDSVPETLLPILIDLGHELLSDLHPNAAVETTPHAAEEVLDTWPKTRTVTTKMRAAETEVTVYAMGMFENPRDGCGWTASLSVTHANEGASATASNWLKHPRPLHLSGDAPLVAAITRTLSK